MSYAGAIGLAATDEAFASIRREIATAAMQGLLANPEKSGTLQSLVETAVGAADALLLELRKPK